MNGWKDEEGRARRGKIFADIVGRTESGSNEEGMNFSCC